MAEVIRFHLDENVNLAIASGLQRRGIDVTTSREAGLIGHRTTNNWLTHCEKVEYS